MEGEIKNMSKISIDMRWCFTSKKSDTPLAKACNEVLDYYLILIKKGDDKTICGTITQNELEKIISKAPRHRGNINIKEENIFIEKIINRYCLYNYLNDESVKGIKEIEISRISNLENNYEEPNVQSERTDNARSLLQEIENNPNWFRTPRLNNSKDVAHLCDLYDLMILNWDEYKRLEGDPQIKQRQRQTQREMAQGRQMGAVPGADVVVTNPVHIALAFKYSPNEMKAPQLVAKGIS